MVVYRPNFIVISRRRTVTNVIVIIIIILFKSGNMAHKHKQETHRQTGRVKKKKQYKMYNKTQ